MPNTPLPPTSVDAEPTSIRQDFEHLKLIRDRRNFGRQQNPRSAPRTDQIGKVFRVVDEDVGEYFICEQFFGRQGELEQLATAITAGMTDKLETELLPGCGPIAGDCPTVNPRAPIGTNPTNEPITSGLPLIRA
jgi:hypothetical protein